MASMVFAIGQRPASASGSALWGVDTVTAISSSFLQTVDSDLGSPQFIGRYLVWGGGTTLSASEASFIHSQGIPILLIASPANSSLTSASVAKSEANQAIAAARALGVPAGVAIFRDVETSYSINAAYIEAWYSAILSAGYFPGFYENPYAASSKFEAAYCSAVASEPAVAATALYSSEPEYTAYTYPRASMPGWVAGSTPVVPTCANNTVAWQYKEGYSKVNVDVDEYNSSESGYLWGDDALVTWQGSPGATGPGSSANLGLAPGTSPVAASLGNGKVAVAFQANTGALWTWQGTPGTTGYGTSTDLGMAAGTSPAITSIGSGQVAIAFQTNTGALWTWQGTPRTTSYGTSTDLGMAAGTSPAITSIGNGKVAIAFQANTGALWTWQGTPATKGTAASSTSLGMAADTSPAMTTFSNKTAVGFQANTSALWTWQGVSGSSGSGASTEATLPPDTSPSIVSLGKGTIAAAL